MGAPLSLKTCSGQSGPPGATYLGAPALLLHPRGQELRNPTKAPVLWLGSSVHPLGVTEAVLFLSGATPWLSRLLWPLNVGIVQALDNL